MSVFCFVFSDGFDDCLHGYYAVGCLAWLATFYFMVILIWIISLESFGSFFTRLLLVLKIIEKQK
jgi:hypothetical protein